MHQVQYEDLGNYLRGAKENIVIARDALSS